MSSLVFDHLESEHEGLGDIIMCGGVSSGGHMGAWPTIINSHGGMVNHYKFTWGRGFIINSHGGMADHYKFTWGHGQPTWGCGCHYKFNFVSISS